MPTYEYRCPQGHEFERFQRMSDKPEAECPECGADAERLLSAGGGLIFKGSGFYITDYRSESYRKEKKKAEKAPSSGGDTSGGSGKAEGSGGGTGSGSSTPTPPSSGGSGGGSSAGSTSEKA